MHRYFILNLLELLFCPIAVCSAQLPYDKFCDSLNKYDPSITEFIIDGSVHAYYKHFYRMPGNYDDLLQLFPKEDQDYLVTLCDSLFYKNRQLITFIPNPDSSALLYSGKIVMGLYSQYTCKMMLTTPVSIGFHMVDTLGHSYYDDSIVSIINKLILPTVYNMAQKTNCKRHYITLSSNMIPCSIPYHYNVIDRTLSVAEDCRENNVKTCGEFDNMLESELGKYDFGSIKIITFPVILYLENNDKNNTTEK